MTTPTDTHTLADEIEALAKKAAGCDPDDHLGRAINHNILVLTMLNNLPAIVAALRERDALKAEVERLRGALEPFAAVAERDIGDDEADHDRYRVMSERNARAPLLCVGHFRRARAALGGGG